MMCQSFNYSDDAAKIKGSSPRISLGESISEGTPVFSEGLPTSKAITHEPTKEVKNLLGSLLNPEKDPPISSQRVGWRNKKAQRKVNLPKIIFEAPEGEPSTENLPKKFDETPESGFGQNYPEISDKQDPCFTELDKSGNDCDVCEEKSDTSTGGRNSGKIRRNHPAGKIINNIGRKDSMDTGVMNYIEKTLQTQKS
jgi:hypothetical protein